MLDTGHRALRLVSWNFWAKETATYSTGAAPGISLFGESSGHDRATGFYVRWETEHFCFTEL